MASILVDNVSIDLPLYNIHQRSLKNSFVRSIGGCIHSNNLQKPYIRALDHLNFSIQNGERVGLIGHNGAGKSTLLRMLRGIYPPKTGKLIRIGNLGSLIDLTLGTHPDATGRENMIIRAALLGLPLKTIYQKLPNMIEFSELEHYIDLPIRMYSSGMLLRLAFSVAMHVPCDILLMDEWIAVGDQHFLKQAEKQLMHYINNTSIFILASHRPELLRKLCHRILWLQKGKIIDDDHIEKVIPKYLSDQDLQLKHPLNPALAPTS